MAESMPDKEKEESTYSFLNPRLYYAGNYSDEHIRRFGVPPPPPPQKKWSCFGEQYSLDDELVLSLESQGIKRFTPVHCDRKKELKKLNISLLVSFLDLLDILIEAPNSPLLKEKLNNIEIMFLNMHQLINEIRPHQARETIRVMMELQNRQRVQAIERLEVVMDRARKILSKTQATIGAEAAEGPIVIDLESDEDAVNTSGAAKEAVAKSVEGTGVQYVQQLKAIMEQAGSLLSGVAGPNTEDAPGPSTKKAISTEDARVAVINLESDEGVFESFVNQLLARAGEMSRNSSAEGVVEPNLKRAEDSAGPSTKDNMPPVTAGSSGMSVAGSSFGGAARRILSGAAADVDATIAGLGLMNCAMDLLSSNAGPNTPDSAGPSTKHGMTSVTAGSSGMSVAGSSFGGAARRILSGTARSSFGRKLSGATDRNVVPFPADSKKSFAERYGWSPLDDLGTWPIASFFETLNNALGTGTAAFPTAAQELPFSISNADGPQNEASINPNTTAKPEE